MTGIKFSNVDTGELSINKQMIRKFVFGDSVFSFIPRVEFTIEDHGCLFSEVLGSIKGIPIDVTIGDTDVSAKDTDYIKFNSVLSKNQIVTSYNLESASGDISAQLVSPFVIADSPKSKSWKNKISEIVTDIFSQYNFKTEDNGSIIEKTEDVAMIHSQPLIDDSTMLNYLASKASSSASGEPYYTFVNARNEFYFTTLKNLITKKNPPKEISIGQGKDLDEMRSNGFGTRFLWTDLDDVINSYNSHYYYIDVTENKVMQYKNQDIKVSDMFPTLSNKLPVLKSSCDSVQSVNMYGLYNGESADKQMMKGFVEGHYKALGVSAIVITFVVGVRPDLASGDVMNVTVLDSNLKDKSQLYSGKYVISETRRLMNSESNTITTMIMMIKPSLDYETTNKFYSKLSST